MVHQLYILQQRIFENDMLANLTICFLDAETG